MNETKFSGKSDVYAKYRPSYPTAFLEFIYDIFHITEDDILADIGSGTGIFTKLLLDKGNTVYAVEPNEDMRAKAETELGAFRHFHSINGSSEHTGLGSGSVDYITVAQAFHWFDVDGFKAECKRVLKPRGAVILVWNNRDDGDELIKKNEEINIRYCKDFTGFSGGIGGPMKVNDDISAFFNGKFETKTFENGVKLDKEGFIGRNLSASYAPRETDENYLPYRKALEALFDECSVAGYVNHPYRTRCYYGNL